MPFSGGGSASNQPRASSRVTHGAPFTPASGRPSPMALKELHSIGVPPTMAGGKPNYPVPFAGGAAPGSLQARSGQPMAPLQTINFSRFGQYHDPINPGHRAIEENRVLRTRVEFLEKEIRAHQDEVHRLNAELSAYRDPPNGQHLYHGGETPRHPPGARTSAGPNYAHIQYHPGTDITAFSDLVAAAAQGAVAAIATGAPNFLPQVANADVAKILSVGAHAPRESGPSVMEILDNEMYVADRHLGNAVDKLRAKITPKEDEDASPTKPSGTPGRSYLRGARNVRGGSGAKSPRKPAGGAMAPSTKHSYSSGRRTPKEKEMGNEKGSVSSGHTGGVPRRGPGAASPRASGGRVKTSVNVSDPGSRRSDPFYRSR